MITIIYATTNDNSRTVLAISRDSSFDIEKWFKSRQSALRLIGIKSIEYEVI